MLACLTFDKIDTHERATKFTNYTEGAFTKKRFHSKIQLVFGVVFTIARAPIDNRVGSIKIAGDPRFQSRLFFYCTHLWGCNSTNHDN